MIWTDGWFHAKHELATGCWTKGISIEEHASTRLAILVRARLDLARAEANALRA